MIQAKHCVWCQHQKINFEFGVICGLTNQKPSFKDTCSDIKFNDLIKRKNTELLIEFQYLKNSKRGVYLNFFSLIILGFLVMTIGIYLLIVTTKHKSIFTFSMSYLFIVFGISILVIAINKVFNFRKKLKSIMIEIDELNRIINKYNITSD